MTISGELRKDVRGERVNPHALSIQLPGSFLARAVPACRVEGLACHWQDQEMPMELGCSREGRRRPEASPRHVMTREADERSEKIPPRQGIQDSTIPLRPARYIII